MTIVDMHCHILPGVDDGSKSMEESLAVLREAARQGVGAMIATPHHHPGRYVVDGRRAREALGRLRQAARAENIGVRLYPGQECYYHSGLVEALDGGEALTMAGSRYVLVEFEGEAMYSQVRQAVRELTESSYRPIIAHFERYRCLCQRRDRLEELKRAGADLQLNFDRLLDRGTLFRPNLWRKLLKDGYVDFLGSDNHGMGYRPLRIAQAMEWLNTGVSRERRDAILETNIGRLLRSSRDAETPGADSLRKG